METSRLNKFAQHARRALMEQASSKLNLVLEPQSAARRENGKAVAELEKQIKAHSREQTIEKIAYTWFNRFCALRYMDVRRFTPVGVVSPASGQFQPEILAEAKMGVLDGAMIPRPVQEKVTGLLNGTVPSPNPQNEAYRLLVVAVCNHYNRIMPFLFQKIADYTELLMPDDLLSGNAILAYTREALSPDACQDVEVIGWLYQFYISEKKDRVFEGLRKNQKITPENVPAATQLFTPHWIVRYLVENSLGRLWMLNRPHSKLTDRMDYYIRPEAVGNSVPESFIRISSPEEIKLCDNACGSGHMLIYAFDLLYAIYEEEGYDAAQIPSLILTHNLYGIEIDERAGELAAFALFMKAREKHRGFFRKPVQPHICILKTIQFPETDLAVYMDAIGRDLFTANLQTLLHQFEEADNFGSLIRPALTHVQDVRDIIQSRGVGNNMFLAGIHDKVLRALEQADYLSPKYHVLVTNPPYMGSKGMHERLKQYALENYPDTKSDLFAMFMERNFDMAMKSGLVAMITMQSWMFLSSFQKLREKILTDHTILSMAHLGERAFDTIGGAVVSTTAFVIDNLNQPDFKAGYLRLISGRNEAEKDAMLRNNNSREGSPKPSMFYQISASDLTKIPGSSIGYWVTDKVREIFAQSISLGRIAETKIGMRTGDNGRFLRFWHETNLSNTVLPLRKKSSDYTKWVPYNKGGNFRKWYGNFDHVVNWENDGFEIKEDTLLNYPQLSWKNLGWKISNEDFYFREGVTWTDLSSASFGVRFLPAGFIFDASGPCLFGKKPLLYLSFFVTKQCNMFLEIMNPTLHFKNYNIAALPFIEAGIDALAVETLASNAIAIARQDWDSYETSWDFTTFPLLAPEHRDPTLAATYAAVRNQWRETTLEMQRLEEENNRIFIEGYGLQDELTPDVPLEEITLTCNPRYRYAAGKTEEEYEKLLLADTMKEFISYAVGCMFGRYSLDRPGLILANQGERVEDYLKQVPNPSFAPDRDNVIPILDQDWFMDDMVGRFYRFLRVTFGEAHFEENLGFIETAIGKDIRKYFLKDFYGDNLKRYKKRPIYWLFSSPRASFNALIYMHRYRPDTVSIVLNEYLREFRAKLKARRDHLEHVSISASATGAEKARALKEVEKLKKTIDELDRYERDTLYPLAARKLEIDLDDGVKVNYAKFGDALKKIPGIDSQE